jgi:hypothetical protein
VVYRPPHKSVNSQRGEHRDSPLQDTFFVGADPCVCPVGSKPIYMEICTLTLKIT